MASDIVRAAAEQALSGGQTRPAAGRRLAFAFDLKLTVLTAAVAGLCVWLGLWQLQRAETRRHTDAAIEARERLPVFELRGDMPMSPEMRFRKVAIKGRFDGRAQILLDNQVHQGQAGVHVITPMLVAGSDKRVLVDRGWLALAMGRALVPDLPVPTGEIEIRGVVDAIGPPPLRLGAAARPGPGWGRLWPYLDADWFRSQFGYAPEPYIVRLDPAEPNGYVRLLPHPERKAAMNTGYAIQWFCFAVLAVAVYVALSLRMGRLRIAPAAA